MATKQIPEKAPPILPEAYKKRVIFLDAKKIIFANRNKMERYTLLQAISFINALKNRKMSWFIYGGRNAAVNIAIRYLMSNCITIRINIRYM